MKSLLILLICMVSLQAQADMLLDLGAIYSSDTLNTSADSSKTQYFYNLNALFNIDKKMTWNLGWSFFGISQTETAGSTNTTYSSQDMGPALRWNIDKNGIFSITAVYGMIGKGTYKTTGGSAENWEGTSLFGQFAVQAPIKEDKFYMGLSLNYYAASYSKKVVSSVESSANNQKTWIFPMISVTWRP